MVSPAQSEVAFVDLMQDLMKGTIRIPEFQRDYVWQSEDVETLLDSIIQDYPIGLLLLWKTTEDMKERDPLQLKLPKREKTTG